MIVLKGLPSIRMIKIDPKNVKITKFNKKKFLPATVQKFRQGLLSLLYFVARNNVENRYFSTNLVYVPAGPLAECWKTAERWAIF